MWAPAEQALVDRIEQQIGAITGCPPHDEEPPLLLMRQRPSEKPPAVGRDLHHPKLPNRFPSGLHVDVNGGLPRRFVSAILYLTTPTSGGQTVFPLAAAAHAREQTSPLDETRAEALDASRRLLRAAVYHTGNSKRGDARTLEGIAPATPTTSTPPRDASHIANGNGVAGRARAGNLLVFWTRAPSGELDPRSWHAGEALGHDSAADKWILRKFKEMPTAEFEDTSRRGAFVERSQRPHLDAARAARTGEADDSSDRTHVDCRSQSRANGEDAAPEADPEGTRHRLNKRSK